MSEWKDEQHHVEKQLWLFEYARPDVSSGLLHLFYAVDEREATTYVEDYLTQAAGRGERLTFRQLKAYPHGFSAGYTEWLGTIHVRADQTVVEGSCMRSIERVAYKGEDVE